MSRQTITQRVIIFNLSFMSQYLRRKVAGLSIVLLIAQIVMPGLAYAANPALTATLTQSNVPAGAEIVQVSVPHDLVP